MRLFLLVLAFVVPLTAHAQPLTVMAAASLTDALKDISALWEKAGHKALQISFGASSTLARQIEQGAPAAIFASADEKWMNYLADRQLIASGTRKSLLSNALVLVVPVAKAKSVSIVPGFDLLGMMGADGRLAVGDPAHVPVGIYAEQALRTLGLWDRVAPRLARTEDVRAALRFVELGEAPVGIVYATDAAISKGVGLAGVFPESSHDPVTYPFAVVRAGDNPEARAFMTFLEAAPARAVFVRRGFKVE
ncbi:MAG: molybdate ABC transporter substrate-binding protein [Rhodospirillales bacterium]